MKRETKFFLIGWVLGGILMAAAIAFHPPIVLVVIVGGAAGLLADHFAQA